MSTALTEYPIETLPQWNAVLAGCSCCAMPECGAPETECESVSANLCGWSLPTHPENADGDACRRFATKRVIITFSLIGDDGFEPPSTFNISWTTTWVGTRALIDDVCTTTFTGSGSGNEVDVTPPGVGGFTETLTIAWTTTNGTGQDPTLAGNYSIVRVFEDPEIEDETDSGPLGDGGVYAIEMTPDQTWARTGDGSYSIDLTPDPQPDENATETKSAVVTFSDEVDAAEFMAEMEWPDPATGSDCIAERLCSSARKSRRRYTVPDAHEGTYFLVMWDILEEPTGWDRMIDNPEYAPPVPNDPPEPVPQIPDPDRPLRSFVSTDNEWEWGGGDRTSDWFVIDPPAVPGTRRAVNGRVWCYRGPYGSLPTLFGEQVAL